MDAIAKVKEWVQQHAPMLSVLFENKYLNMVYDRFGSLPAKEQKLTVMGVALGFVGLISLYLLISYWSLVSQNSKTQNTYSMVNLLLQYQKEKRDKTQQIQDLTRNNQLSAQGALKQSLIDAARSSNISARMVTAEEKPDAGPSDDDPKASSEIRIKQATVALQRVTLSQLSQYLKALEFGRYNLSVSSIKISNDDKIRGYMNVNLTVIAHLFSAEEG